MKEGLKIGTEIVTDKIKAIDRYSRAITFTYKNKDSFGTTFGGFVSVAHWIYLSPQVRNINPKILLIFFHKIYPYNYFCENVVLKILWQMNIWISLFYIQKD